MIHFKDSCAGWRAYSGHACSLNAINIFCSSNYQRIFSDLSLSLSLFYLFWPRFKSVIDYVFVYPPTCLRELRLERSEVTKFSTQFPTQTTQLWNFLSFLQVPTHNACAKHLLLLFLLFTFFFAGVLNCFSVVFDGFCHFSWAIKAARASLMRSENEMKVERDVVDVLELELKSQAELELSLF